MQDAFDFEWVDEFDRPAQPSSRRADRRSAVLSPLPADPPSRSRSPVAISPRQGSQAAGSQAAGPPARQGFPPGPLVGPPGSLPGTEWWATPMLALMWAHHPQPQPCRPMTNVSGCCGTAGELDIFVTLSMKVTTRALCDTKALARDFVTRRPLGGACMFCSLSDMTHGGACSTHHRHCDPRSAGAIDLSVQGLPCQPFTRMRTDPVAVQEHPLFKVVFKDFFEFLDTRSPGGTITEETPDFIRKKAPCGATYLQLFLEGLHQRGHYTAAHLLSTAPATVTRDRVYIVSLTEHLGGQAALDYISGTIDAIQAHMAAATPLDIRTIVGNKTSTQLEQLKEAIKNKRQTQRQRERERQRERAREGDGDKCRQTLINTGWDSS